MRIARLFTEEGRDVYEDVPFRTTSSEIRNPDGSKGFSAKAVEVPADWSQGASDILAQKYFRKRGVPQRRVRLEAEGVPAVLWPSRPGEKVLHQLSAEQRKEGDGR